MRGQSDSSSERRLQRWPSPKVHSCATESRAGTARDTLIQAGRETDRHKHNDDIPGKARESEKGGLASLTLSLTLRFTSTFEIHQRLQRLRK